MDLSSLKISTVMLVLSGIGLLLGLLLIESSGPQIIFTAKILALIGALLAVAGK